MSLNKQHFDIVTALTMQGTSINALASVFNMTSRNLRYAIENINFYLEKLAMTPIELTNGELHYPYDASQFFSDVVANNFIYSKHEREEYIAVIALFSPQTLLSDIQQYLRVSRPTLNKDLRNINEMFNNLAIKLEVIEQQLHVSGKEKQIRYLQMCYASKYLFCKNEQVHYLQKRYFYERDVVAIVQGYLEKYRPYSAFSAVSRIEQNANCVLSDEFRNLFTIYLMVTLSRIEQGVLINRKNNGMFLQSTKAFGYIKQALGWQQESHHYEALHLAEYFLGGINTDGFYEKRFQAESFIFQLLSEVSHDCGKDLLCDTTLLNDIVNYLTTAVYRAKNNLNTQIGAQSAYSKALFEQIKAVAEQYRHHLVEPLRNEEIGYITRLVNRTIEVRNQQSVSLKQLLAIAKNHCRELNSEGFVSQLVEQLGDQVIDDRTLPGLDDLLITLKDTSQLATETDLVAVLSWLSGEMERLGLVNHEYSGGIVSLYYARNHAYFAQHGLLVCHGKSASHCQGIAIVHLPLPKPITDIFQRNIRQVMLISHMDNVQHVRAVHQLHQKLTEQGPFALATDREMPVSNRSTSALSAFHPVE
ncbi:transcription antiterminator BglG [Vibrio panuliri]|uniref:Transcription antiterminator BglG n=1 Tax=Vibrio panuliri TaxID=1381081 RepID=A0A1Q9HJU5_9VIBR|nr:helix-turn-helix domain-containing protein [Vibrio panuliri]OLQ90571.1 transcription antiterminator BglG [Vibrio panuliri]